MFILTAMNKITVCCTALQWLTYIKTTRNKAVHEFKIATLKQFSGVFRFGLLKYKKWETGRINLFGRSINSDRFCLFEEKLREKKAIKDRKAHTWQA